MIDLDLKRESEMWVHFSGIWWTQFFEKAYYYETCLLEFRALYLQDIGVLFSCQRKIAFRKAQPFSLNPTPPATCPKLGFFFLSYFFIGKNGSLYTSMIFNSIFFLMYVFTRWKVLRWIFWCVIINVCILPPQNKVIW